MCATASSAATTFAARTGQLMRDIGRLHNSTGLASTGLALEVLAVGTSHSTLHSLGYPRSQFCGRTDRADRTHPIDHRNSAWKRDCQRASVDHAVSLGLKAAAAVPPIALLAAVHGIALAVRARASGRVYCWAVGAVAAIGR